MRSMKNLIARIYLDLEVSRLRPGVCRLYLGGPGGRGTSREELSTREMRILAYELLSNAETIDAMAAAPAQSN